MLFLNLCLSAWAQTESLLMPDGAYGTTVKAGLAPGEIRTYYLNAEQGQQLTARLECPESAAYLLITDNAGQSLLETLPESTQVRSLDIIFPRTGRYKIAVGGGEGQCSYLLEVTLDWPEGSRPEEPAKTQGSSEG